MIRARLSFEQTVTPARRASLDEAIADFQAALRMKLLPLADAHNGVGIRFLGRETQVTPFRKIPTALVLIPRTLTRGRIWGLALLRTGELQESLAALRTADQLAPGSAQIRYRLGLALSAGGQTEVAAQEFTAAVKLKPDYPEAEDDLGVALVSLGKVDDGIARVRPSPRPAARRSGGPLPTSGWHTRAKGM